MLTPDDRPLTRLGLVVDLERLIGDETLQVAVLDAAHHAAVRVQVSHDLDDLGLGGIGERFDEVRTPPGGGQRPW